MILSDLPNEVLILIFSKYISLDELLSISQCCKFFKYLVFNFIINKIDKYPVLDLNYPFGNLKIKIKYIKYIKFSRL